ncbi:hypothetical protein B1R94_02335 [Mycolicibacterium litorale]|nr:hypothetical protein B1R94_02335 [Mycolicibacterium litorale]
MREAFDPDSASPPAGRGSTTVRFFAGDENALQVWDPDARGGCADPFLWVRVPRRFRSRTDTFPQAYVGDWGCNQAGVISVVEIEVGVGRCASIDPAPKWSDLERENEISLDDSWRIELVLRRGVCKLRTPQRAVATDTVGVAGPAGGAIAWSGVAYVQLI